VSHPTSAAPVLDAPKRRRRRPHQGFFWLTVLVALIVFIGGTVAAVSSFLGAAGPDSQVRAYFGALARGDAKAALGFGAVPAGDHRYLTSAVLREQLKLARISHVVIVEVDTAGAVSDVDVTYQLGSSTISDRVPLVKRGGSWRLQNSAVLVSVSLTQAAHRATFASTAIPATQVVLLPGIVPLAFDTPVLQLATGSGIVRFAGSSTSDMTAQVTSAGARTVTAAVTQRLVDCVSAARPAALCPVPDKQIRSVPASLHGKILGTPSITPSVAADADGTISITGTVQVQGTYDALDYDNQITATTGQVTLTFHAHCYASTPTTIVWDVVPT
jgi:hypothetical protein